MNDMRTVPGTTNENSYRQKNPEMFDRLLELTQTSDKYASQLKAKGKKKDLKRGIRPKYQDLYEWILENTPMQLSGNAYSLQTKIFWILNGITDWSDKRVKCQYCGRPFTDKNVINLYTGYHEYCSLSCAGRSEKTNDKKLKNCMEKYGVAHPSQLKSTVNARKKTTKAKYGNENWNNAEQAKRTRETEFNGRYSPPDHAEKCKAAKIANGHAQNWNNSERSKATRLRRNGGQYESAESRSRREQTCLAKFGCRTNLQSEETKLKGQLTCREKYGVNYYSQTPEFKQRSIKTMTERYGCAYTMQNPVFQRKAKRRYMYDGLNFDTMPELAYYIWLTNIGIRFEYHPDRFFEFLHDGATHRYFPDFFLPDSGEYVEIKGDQFFRPDGTMFCPYRKKNQTDEEYEKTCSLYEAKRQCMIANNVKILKSQDYAFCLEYVKSKYGTDYLKRFRKA